MTTAELRADRYTWSTPIDPEATPTHALAWTTIAPVLSGLCLAIVDFAIIVGGFLVAHWVRFAPRQDATLTTLVDEYIHVGVVAGFLSLIGLALHGFYDEDRSHTWPVRVYIIVCTISIALLAGITFSYFVGDPIYSRLWFATSWAFGVVGLSVWRTIAHGIDNAVHDTFAPSTRVLIVGANPLGRQVAQYVQERRRLVGYVDNGSDLEDTSETRLLGPISQLEHLVNTLAVDEVIIALPADRREQVGRILERGFSRHVTVKMVSELAELVPRRFDVERFGGQPYIGFAAAARVSWLKRAVDLLATSMGLLLISPLLLAIALTIKLDSPGPVFYRQERVGKHGRRFNMLKFRSMRPDADKLLVLLREHNEASGPLFKMRRDPRVTRVGRILRRLSLDELPQLLNVLKGEMSLVGPRPPLPSEVAEYEDWQFGRLRAVPGITGLWQVSGRSEVPFQDMVRLDLHYIRNWSLGLDLEILVRTIPAVLTSRGAY
jgi:exopolysaccharide biosynthesis polyprenyl glycosylphosphotransferase